MRRPPPAVILVVIFVALAIAAQLIPLYTDWLWFGEVGYTDVFLSILSLRGTLFTAMLLSVLIFLWVNLAFAARTAAPDVVWELEDQLGLPGRVVIEPLLRRFLPAVLMVIAIVAGLRATTHWATVVGYVELYGQLTGQVSARMEVASTLDGPALKTIQPGGQATAEADKFLLLGEIPIADLKPGDYVVRAFVSIQGQPEGRVVRTLRKVQ